jgi:hypothetical protein
MTASGSPAGCPGLAYWSRGTVLRFTPIIALSRKRSVFRQLPET